MELSPLRPDQTDDGAFYDKLDAKRTPSRSRIIILACIALLLIAGVAVVLTRDGSNTAAAPAKPTLTGVVELRSTSVNYNVDLGGRPMSHDLWCEGRPSSGYKDLVGGAQVLVVDGAGVTIASGTLAEGRRDGTVICRFDFSIPNVPKADFYQVKVSQRGGPTYSFAEMEARAWRVELTIGG